MSDVALPWLADVQSYRQRLDNLLLFRGIFDDAPGQAFLALIEALSEERISAGLQAYAHWFQALATSGTDWPTHLVQQILWAENPFSVQAQSTPCQQLPAALIRATQHDLAILQQFYHLGESQVAAWVQAMGQLDHPPVAWALPAASPRLPTVEFPTLADWQNGITELATYYQHHGAGRFGRYRAFTWQTGQLQGIAAPDPIRLSQLTAYAIPRQQLIQNTRALMAGYAALHVLLYGSRGAGKSSLVKALLNEYHQDGLRLIEVSKSHLQDLPTIVDQVRHAPQKFIIFVDDLSFEEDDDAFKALKVVLEGSVTARPQNVVVYATSNRRHLVREFFSERPRPSDQDEIQAWDTLQEKLSFSDRFGLTLTFEPADQTTYLAIVQHLAQQAAIPLPEPELTHRALQWATRHNGRSGRTARQFIDALRAELELPAAPTDGLAPVHP